MSTSPPPPGWEKPKPTSPPQSPPPPPGYPKPPDNPDSAVQSPRQQEPSSPLNSPPPPHVADKPSSPLPLRSAAEEVVEKVEPSGSPQSRSLPPPPSGSEGAGCTEVVKQSSWRQSPSPRWEEASCGPRSPKQEMETSTSPRQPTPPGRENSRSPSRASSPKKLRSSTQLPGTLPPTGPEMGQMACGSCDELLSYPKTAMLVKCPCCEIVNFVLEEHQVGNVECGRCSVLLMYPYGAPLVRCSCCRFVTKIGAHNLRPPLSVQQGRPPPALMPC